LIGDSTTLSHPPAASGVDTGGTYTDLVLFDRGRLFTLKVPSTPDDLTRGIIAGIDELPAQTGIAADAVERFVYATTYATNLIVEGKSSRIGLVTTHGFRDVLEIGRASRKPHIYDIHWRPAPPLLPRKLRRTVRERIDNAGAVPEPPDEAETRAVLAALGAEGCEAIAVTFLHAYANPAHERRVAELAQEICPEVEVSISTEVVRGFREFERTSTTVANAFIKRPLQGHLGILRRELDRGEKLRVGPRSAGSVPRPACYGQGGEAATVTDCNLIAGQLNPGYFVAGARRLNTGCARTTLRERIADPLGLTLEAAALGVIAISEAQTVDAMRLISVDRGIGPRDFTLAAFGGAGPLHVIALAEALSMRRVLIPPAPGNLSATGLILADIRHDLVRTVVSDLAGADRDRLVAVLGELLEDAEAALTTERVAPHRRVLLHSADLRYQGQNYELNVPITTDLLAEGRTTALAERFHEQHRIAYGYHLTSDRSRSSTCGSPRSA
jgi:N-methylhydantoinase A/oxoprolinase/acetone carboxylase beta subunit